MSKGFSAAERNQAILNCLDKLKKKSKVFHLRWCPGDLLDEKVLKSTPLFWYMRFGWSRADVEALFLDARVYVDPVLNKAMDQVFGVNWQGARWLPPDKQLEKQKQWKKRTYKRKGPWWKTKALGQLHASQMTDKGNMDFKASKWNYDKKPEGMSHEEWKALRERRAREQQGKKKGDLPTAPVRKRSSHLDTKLESKKKDIWAAVSNYNENPTVNKVQFIDNLKDKNIIMSDLVASKLFDQCVPSGQLDPQTLGKLLSELDKIKASLDPNLGQISLSDLDTSLGASTMMKRVLLAASGGVPFTVDEFLASAMNIAHMAPVTLMGKLVSRDADWDERLHTMEDLSNRLGKDPALDPLLSEEQMPSLLMGWMTQCLDNRENVSKPAIQMLPNVYNECLNNGDNAAATEMFSDVADGLFKVMDNPRYKKNHDDAEDALKDIIDNIVQNGHPEDVVYVAGVLADHTDIENTTSAPGREFAMDQMKKILLGPEAGKEVFGKLDDNANKRKDVIDPSKDLPPDDSPNKEWLDIAANKKDGPSDKLMDQGENGPDMSNVTPDDIMGPHASQSGLAKQRGKNPRSMQNAAAGGGKGGGSGRGDAESNAGGPQNKGYDDIEYGSDEEYPKKAAQNEEFEEYGGDTQNPRVLPSQRTEPGRKRRQKGKDKDVAIKFGSMKGGDDDDDDDGYDDEDPSSNNAGGGDPNSAANNDNNDPNNNDPNASKDLPNSGDGKPGSGDGSDPNDPNNGNNGKPGDGNNGNGDPNNGDPSGSGNGGPNNNDDPNNKGGPSDGSQDPNNKQGGGKGGPNDGKPGSKNNGGPNSGAGDPNDPNSGGGNGGDPNDPSGNNGDGHGDDDGDDDGDNSGKKGGKPNNPYRDGAGKPGRNRGPSDGGNPDVGSSDGAGWGGGKNPHGTDHKNNFGDGGNPGGDDSKDPSDGADNGDGGDGPRDPKEIGDDFRECVNAAVGNALMDPNKKNADEAAKVTHFMNEYAPGYSKGLDPESQKRYFKWKAGPMKKARPKAPTNKPLPQLHVGAKRLHKIDQNVEFTIAPPVLPDI